jgi:S-(hydroxymethyl)glutathione dehydrogenase/alcohol dehydrogenase
MLK